MVEFNAPVPDRRDKNRHPRCPCVLVLDASSSMSGDAITKLNAAVATLSDEMKGDKLAIRRVEFAIVSFPPVRTVQPFATLEAFVPPKLAASGSTPLGAAVMHALKLIEERKAAYRAEHLEWFRPWLFLVTDGEPDPSDDWRGAAAAVRHAEADNKVAFSGVGVPGADMDVLAQFSHRPPLNLVDLRFREMIQWLSRSMKAVSQSGSHTGGDPKASVPLPGVVGWGEGARVNPAPSYDELWNPVGEAAPPIDPRQLKAPRDLQPVRPDFLDWAVDVPDPEAAPQRSRSPAPSRPGPSPVPQTPPPSSSRGPSPWDLPAAAADDMSWAQGTPKPPPPGPEPIAVPSPRRPVWVARKPNGPWAGGDIIGRDNANEYHRIIDANLLAERFVPGEMATLTIAIRLPDSPRRGKWQREMTLEHEQGPVQLILETQGFTVLSEPPPPFEVPKARDTAPLAFELRIEEASSRWLHIVFTQQGRPVGELTITDFSLVGQGPTHQTSSSPFRSVPEADLMLVVRATDGRIEACSPRERASLDHVTMTGFKYPATPFREILAERLRALYDDRSDPRETDRELRIVGAGLAECLPSDLVKLLRRPDIRSVMLRHEDDFDFPLELVYLDDQEDPFFVGDRIAICRWYLGVTNLPDMISKQVGKVAFLKGSAEAFASDEALLHELYPGRTRTFESRTDIIEQVLKTSDFDLIHFTGHCQEIAKAGGGLELADGSFLRLIEIGQLESERTFAAAQPFIMLNACSSAQPYLGLTQRGSFAHRFVTSRACAVVGTLWPVAGAVANEFARRFYAELTHKPIGQALVATKLALMDDSDGSSLRLLARKVAARSYCLFANPDLRLMS